MAARTSDFGSKEGLMRIELDEVSKIAEDTQASRGRVLIWIKEGRRRCAICDRPVIMANYALPAHLDVRVTQHVAK